MRRLEEAKEKKKAAKAVPVKRAPVEEDSDDSDDDTEARKLLGHLTWPLHLKIHSVVEMTGSESQQGCCDAPKRQRPQR